MSARSIQRLLVAVAALATLVLSGCGSSAPTRLYVLSPSVAQPASMSANGIAVGVGPITLPKYLDRPQMVTQTSANQLTEANLDQWGGDLNDNVTRVLAANLSNILGTERVSLYPWKDRVPMDYQVTMDVAKFESGADGSAELDVFWSIVNPADGSVLEMRRSSYRSSAAPAGGPVSYDASAAAMSRDLGLLSQDVAKTILALKGG